MTAKGTHRREGRTALVAHTGRAAALAGGALGGGAAAPKDPEASSTNPPGSRSDMWPVMIRFHQLGRVDARSSHAL
eukprot:2807968-Alexandrium_andersonii.AAC.1